MASSGRFNALTDVSGLQVGHYTRPEAACGVTVVVCPAGAVAAVDVRGAAPGTRETDLLNPVNLVEKAQAVVLAGGSVYGLAAADGVVGWLAERGLGFPLEQGHVAPIVPSAVLYDLGRGSTFIPPVSAQWGRLACEAAAVGPVAMGCVGAGTGARAGAIKGGAGTASRVLEGGLTVAALVVVNSFGSSVDERTGRLWECGLEIDGEFGPRVLRSVRLPALPDGAPAHNTTLGIVATDAILTKAQAQKVAQMAHDGLARAIRPCHTMFDGDTIFCLATGKQPLTQARGFFAAAAGQAISVIGHGAADCMARAIVHAILSASSSYGICAFKDLETR
jgi:L-aminopeptidase/D-esterase-like protein